VTRAKLLRDLEVEERSLGKNPDAELLRKVWNTCKTSSEVCALCTYSYITAPDGRAIVRWRMKDHLRPLITAD